MDSELGCFNWAASFFDHTRSIPEVLLEKMTELLSKQVELTKCSKILEIGIGTGRITIPLAQKLQKFSIDFYGVDIAEKMLDICRKKIDTECKLQLLLAEGSQLPFSTRFDIIFTSHVLHLVKSPFQFIDLFLKNLSPKGKYINLEAYTDYQNTFPFSFFYKKLYELGYRHYFRTDLINREISVYLTQRGWKYQSFTYNDTIKIKISMLVRFLRNQVFSHQRMIPNDLYYRSLDYLYREIEKKDIDLSLELTVPSISRVNIFYK